MSKAKRVSAVVLVAAMVSVLGVQVSQAAPVRYISVSSVGTVKVTPDAVRLNTSVSTISKVSKDALAAANVAASKFRAAILANGIDKKYLASTTLTVYPEYNYTQESGSKLIGYRSSQSFAIIIRNAANAGDIVDSVIAAGGDNLQINGVTPFVLDSTKSAEAARAVAVKTAKTKASAYAKLLGVKLGKVAYLNENSSPVYSGPVFAMAKDSAAATQIDLGQQEITVTVEVRWNIG